MTLRQLAETQLATLVESQTQGFGHEVTLVDPDGVSEQVVGLNCDIAQSIDPTTGMIISGRTASITFRNSTMINLFGKLPVAITETINTPWTVVMNDINGVTGTFKICRTMPDRTIGIVVCFLENYNS